VTIDTAHADVRVRAHPDDSLPRQVEGDMDLKTQTGLIHLAVDGHPFFIDAESQINVRSDLPPRRGGISLVGPESAPAHSYRRHPPNRL
jgi:hypothetical protein